MNEVKRQAGAYACARDIKELTDMGKAYLSANDTTADYEDDYNKSTTLLEMINAKASELLKLCEF